MYLDAFYTFIQLALLTIGFYCLGRADEQKKPIPVVSIRWGRIGWGILVVDVILSVWHLLVLSKI
jgi:hypothetical protein